LGHVRAFERSDLHECGRLLLQSYTSLRDDYEVSLPEIDLLVALADEARPADIAASISEAYEAGGAEVRR
jgi:galactokinase